MNGNTYRLPSGLTPFQREMYIHLINWKWHEMNVKEPGIYKYKGQELEYDAILPYYIHKRYPLLYPGLINEIDKHRKKYYFKFHQHFNHMASSQVANINLFLPILLHPIVNDVFRQLKFDFNILATEQLFSGFRIEFWDGTNGDDKGLLGDHNYRSGTDSDIAIVYRNHQNELCLWLIEHKLTEKEFTICGGAKSKGRDIKRHNCNKSFSEIIKNKQYCYYHDVRKTNYWKITESNQNFFPNHQKYTTCPFKGGMNQLWRNQLLGLTLESIGTYKHVYFSVVRHPDNHALNHTILAYKQLVNNNPKFSVLSSKTVLDIVKKHDNRDLNKWATWYNRLYKII